MEALVVVGLENLDAFASEWGALDAAELGLSIARAVASHDGPVYMVGDGLAVGAPGSGPRDQAMGVARRRPDVVWVPPAAGGGWAAVLGALPRRLGRDGVSSARIGGVWADRGGGGGLVDAAARAFSAVMPAEADPAITGFAATWPARAGP